MARAGIASWQHKYGPCSCIQIVFAITGHFFLHLRCMLINSSISPIWWTEDRVSSWTENGVTAGSHIYIYFPYVSHIFPIYFPYVKLRGTQGSNVQDSASFLLRPRLRQLRPRLRQPALAAVPGRGAQRGALDAPTGAMALPKHPGRSGGNLGNLDLETEIWQMVNGNFRILKWRYCTI